MHLCFLDAKFQLLEICCSQLYLEETTFFWLRTQLAHFVGVEGNNSSKQRQIDPKFWPQVVLIVVQMPFKGFWKAQIFAENFYSTQSLSFWPNFEPNLAPDYGENRK